MSHPYQEEGVNFPPNTETGKMKIFTFTETYGPKHGFREGTKVHPAPMYFILTNAGMGDYINYSSSFVWIAENCPWIYGTIIVSEFLVEFLETVMKPYRNWSVRPGHNISITPDHCFMGPDLTIGGSTYNHPLLNPTGAHLLDLGFTYYANMQAAPAGWTLPYVTFPESKVPAGMRGRDRDYVVFTPGGVTPARTVYGKHINPLIHWVKDALGLTPVFLGKNEFSIGVNPKFPEDIDYGAGIDLRNRTTVCQAAAVMERSAAVVGLDNGLLHLAACTKAPLVFGYNITTKEHREPRRKVGQTEHIFLTKEELACTACQSHLKHFVNFSFHNCIYGDTKCIDLLFANEAERWKLALSKLITRG